ncbi:MFS transporter [Sporolactobacillus pectinivorans]|uniref:MFS transporter n=1 Tax=Sporolactobacillus pectinivorans TaxID=1591408 RepID=UPI0019608614|nr:MFS transporter [Sporolactobacillus pectinivorans]
MSMSGGRTATIKKLVPDILLNISFRRYWIGQTVSLFGDEITSLALPLTAVLILHASAGVMGILTAAGWLPFLLLGIHAGAWVDRLGRRRQIMIIADSLRALLLIAIPISYLIGSLTVTELLIIAFIIGILSVLFNVSASTLFVSMVPRKQYVEANSLLNGSRAVAFLGGPSIGGFLAQFLSAPIALVADALSFITSALFLSHIHAKEPSPVKAEPGYIGTGLRFIRDTPILRYLLISVATINLFNFIYSALFILYVTRVLYISPGQLGLVLGCGSLGSVLGSIIANKMSNHFGLGVTLLFGSILFPLPLILVPLAGGTHLLILVFLFFAAFFSGLGVMLLDISSGSINAAAIPAEIRARVSGAWGFVNNGIRPIGALIGSILPTFFGLHGAMWIGTVGACFGFLWLFPSHIIKLRDVNDFVTEGGESNSTDL